MLGMKLTLFFSLAILVVDVHGFRKRASDDVTSQGEKTGTGLMKKELLNEFPDADEGCPEVLEPSDSIVNTPAPLCFCPIVKRTCDNLRDKEDGKRLKSTDNLLKEVLDASGDDVKSFLDALHIPGQLPCMRLCKKAVKYARKNNLIVPKEHDKGCIKTSDGWRCDVELHPKNLAKQEEVDLESTELPDAGPDVAADNSSSVLEGGAQSIVARRTSVVSKPSEGANPAAFVEIGAVAREGPVPRTVEQMVMATLALFRIHVAHPDDDKRIIIDEKASSLVSVNGTSARSSSSAIATSKVQARAWVSTVLAEMGQFATSSLRSKWFGGSGTISTSDVRTRILRTFNFMDRELADMNYYYPADQASNTACGGTTLAYVWKWQSNEQGYSETQGPKCDSFSQAGSNQCAVDASGNYIVYLCRYWYESFGEIARTSTLVHEAAHHTGPSDVSYNVGQIQSMSQANQLNNAANYQRFGEDLTLTAWGCADSDTVSGLPYTCSGGPCSCGPFKDLCQDGTHGSTLRQQCPATCGQCQAPTNPPRRRRAVSDPRRRRAVTDPRRRRTASVPRRRRSTTSPCTDSTTYVNPVFNDRCPDWVGYNCNDDNMNAAQIAELKENCPVACQTGCTTTTPRRRRSTPSPTSPRRRRAYVPRRRRSTPSPTFPRRRRAYVPRRRGSTPSPTLPRRRRAYVPRRRRSIPSPTFPRRRRAYVSPFRRRRTSSNTGGNSCNWANDGTCDVPRFCDAGTDDNDCA